MEPGPLAPLPTRHIIGVNDNDGKQVDDDGESYWIFESRDVGLRFPYLFIYSDLEHALRAKAFAACQSSRLPVSYLLGVLDSSYSELTLPLRLFWTALYVFPALWLGLFFVSLLKFNLSSVKKRFISAIITFVTPLRRFVPIVVLALVFNITNVIGFTYACVPPNSHIPLVLFSLPLVSDRDANKRWAQNVVSSSWSMGGLGGQMLTGVVKNSVGRVFGS